MKEKINSKNMAFAMWGIVAISFVLYIITGLIPLIKSGYLSYGIISIITTILTYVMQSLIGYAIYRDKNDRTTLIIILLSAAVSFNLGGVVAIIMRLLIRKNDNEKIRNLWFLPAIVSAVSVIVVAIIQHSQFGFNLIISIILSALFYIIFGYWFIRYLKLN